MLGNNRKPTWEIMVDGNDVKKVIKQMKEAENIMEENFGVKK